MSHTTDGYIDVVGDLEEGTLPDHLDEVNIGAAPKAIAHAETTVERCVVCGHAPRMDRFEAGVKHAMQRLGVLLVQRAGTSQEEADAILKVLTARDVEMV